jgi:hypothetical protein
MCLPSEQAITQDCPYKSVIQNSKSPRMLCQLGLFVSHLRVSKALLDRLSDSLQLAILKPFERNLRSSLGIFSRIFKNTQGFRIRRIVAGWFHNDPGLRLIVYEHLNHFSFIG